MIKKDINKDLQTADKETVIVVTADANDAVDQIFAEADQIMQEDANTINSKKETKKKKKRPFLKFCLVSLVIIFLFAAVSIGLLIYSANQAFPSMKATLISGLTEAQHKLLELDDSTLSPIDVCSKKIFLLISVDKIDQNINSIGDLIKFTNDVNRGLDIDTTFIDEADHDVFQQLIQEYNDLKAAGYVQEEGYLLIPDTTDASNSYDNPYRND